jgi:hypothetical protein
MLEDFSGPVERVNGLYTRMLRKHIDKERDIVFPLAESVLSPEEKAVLDGSLRRSKASKELMPIKSSRTSSNLLKGRREPISGVKRTTKTPR